MHGVTEPRYHPINKGGQDERAEVSPPAFAIGIQLLLIERRAAIVQIRYELVPVSSGLVVTLQPLEDFKGLVGRGDGFVYNLGRLAILGELGRIEAAQLVTSKGGRDVIRGDGFTLPS